MVIQQSNKNNYIARAKFIALTLNIGFYKYRCFIDVYRKIEFVPDITYICNTSHHSMFETYNLKDNLNHWDFSVQLDNNEDDGVLIDSFLIQRDSTMIKIDWFCIVGEECVDEYEINAKHYPHTVLLLNSIETDGYVDVLLLYLITFLGNMCIVIGSW